MSASSGYGTGGSGPVGPFIETLTGNVGGPVGPDVSDNINIVGASGVLVTGNPGTNTLTITAPGEATIYTEDVGTATPSGGNLNVIGGPSTAGGNMNTAGAGDTVQVILNDSLLFPNTNNTGTEGVLFWGGDRFIHNYGATNTFVGGKAGNLTLGTPFATENTGIGNEALTSIVGSLVNLGAANTAIGNDAGHAVTDGSWNCFMGNAAGQSVTTGQGNTLIGNEVALNMITGSTNVLIGGDDNLGALSAGKNYVGAESNNIIIGSNPGVAAESNVMRLGLDGAGVAQQNATYIAGIYNRSFASPSGVVQIDHNFKVGSSAGSNGQLLIGSTGASPLWANLTSTGGSIVITNAPNAINLEATGTGAGASQFPVDIGGPADEAGGILNIFGGPGILSGVNNIHTQAVALSNTVRIVLNDSLKFPITHADGSGGILYWNNVPTIQFLGSGNSFLGSGAGNLTLTTGSAIDNTAVGENCLPALTTSPENTFIGSNAGTLLASGSGLNTAAGFAVLDNLVSGSNNIAIGTLAGTNYTTNESNNILLASFGVVGDNQTIRIGRTQTAAYMQGIYNASIGSTNAAVYIDNTGKLGTKESSTELGNPSFMVRCHSPAEVITAGGPPVGVFFLGAQNVMTIVYDNFGVFFIGNGAGTAANFTAPIDGFYAFTLYIELSPVSSGSTLDPQIYVNASLYQSTACPIFGGSGGMKTMAASAPSVGVSLTAGDVVTFAADVNATITNPPGGFMGNSYIFGQLLQATP